VIIKIFDSVTLAVSLSACTIGPLTIYGYAASGAGATSYSRPCVAGVNIGFVLRPADGVAISIVANLQQPHLHDEPPQ